MRAAQPGEFDQKPLDARTAAGTIAVNDAALREQATEALRRAVAFFRNEVAVEGTYLWEYSEDLSRREGEGVATRTQGWVQPPGTPTVGMAFLEAHEATGERAYLEAARETAHGLVRGQLQTGGWYYYIDFDPNSKRPLAYREGDRGSARKSTTFDDDTTQSALRFMMRTDQALEFRDAKVHEAVVYALDAVFKAQYANGAWPQTYDQFPEQKPVLSASYPDAWPREWPDREQYRIGYTLNDNVLVDLIQTLFLAEKILGSGPEASKGLAGRARRAAENAGRFVLIAQMPEPQPAWAQQYDFEMHPCWARKFEPPSLTGGESQGVLEVLLLLFRETGDRRYLEPIPLALDYLRRCRLSDGRLARFYELQSNRPLYFTRDYHLTYDDSDVPTHYAFKVPDRTGAIERSYRKALGYKDTEQAKAADREANGMPDLTAQVKSVIAAQDEEGRWLEEGPLRYHVPQNPQEKIIRSSTFARNINLLSRYLSKDKR